MSKLRTNLTGPGLPQTADAVEVDSLVNLVTCWATTDGADRVSDEILSLRTLRELGRSYQTLSQDLNRVMNRIKALYRGWSIPCAGTQVYAPSKHFSHSQLSSPGAQAGSGGGLGG
jgi:hypothetical protein